jgi:hypothetical protein
MGMFPKAWLFKTVYLYAMSLKELVFLIICHISMIAIGEYLSFYWQNIIIFKLIFYIVAQRNCLLKHVIEGHNGRTRKKM